MAKAKSNKSQAIRNYFTANPKAKAKEVGRNRQSACQ